jgi:hemoglobin
MNAPLTFPPTFRGTPVPHALDEALIGAVVDTFYDRVRADDVLGPIFNARIAPDAWPLHLERMRDFWSSVLLRTGRYAGQPLRPHLEMDEVEDKTFERWLALFRQTVEDACDPETAARFMEMAQRIARSFRMALAFHRGESPPDWPRMRHAQAGRPETRAPIDDTGDVRSHRNGPAGRVGQQG